jgi:hypothetical protein
MSYLTVAKLQYAVTRAQESYKSLAVDDCGFPQLTRLLAHDRAPPVARAHRFQVPRGGAEMLTLYQPTIKCRFEVPPGEAAHFISAASRAVP